MFENIAFGLRIAKLPAKEIEERVTEMLEIVSLKGFEKRKPTSSPAASSSASRLPARS